MSVDYIIHSVIECWNGIYVNFLLNIWTYSWAEKNLIKIYFKKLFAYSFNFCIFYELIIQI